MSLRRPLTVTTELPTPINLMIYKELGSIHKYLQKPCGGGVRRVGTSITST